MGSQLSARALDILAEAPHGMPTVCIFVAVSAQSFDCVQDRGVAGICANAFHACVARYSRSFVPAVRLARVEIPCVNSYVDFRGELVVTARSFVRLLQRVICVTD
jgi:hypothetical protein